MDPASRGLCLSVRSGTSRSVVFSNLRINASVKAGESGFGSCSRSTHPMQRQPDTAKDCTGEKDRLRACRQEESTKQTTREYP